MFSRHRIDQPLWPEYDGLTFSFNMINYIEYQNYGDSVFNEICEAVSKCYKSKVPISTRLLENYRIYPIPENHTLYQYLDSEAQKSPNFLVFLRKEKCVLVVWYGPFIDASHLGDIHSKLTHSHVILKEIAEAVKLGVEDKEKVELSKKELVEKYWKNVKDALAKIEAKKIELKGEFRQNIRQELYRFVSIALLQVYCCQILADHITLKQNHMLIRIINNHFK